MVLATALPSGLDFVKSVNHFVIESGSAAQAQICESFVKSIILDMFTC